MNIGLFGGTFDPIHVGHIALARAAMEHFELGRVLFMPASVPPHKKEQPKASYFDRYAMVALATAEEKSFVPSGLEAPQQETLPGRSKKGSVAHPNYSIETVRLVKKSLRKSDHLFFLIGIDAFQDIAKWYEAEALLKECDFIVASRPGYSLADVATALPGKIRPSAAVTKPFSKQPAKGDLVLSGATIRLLDGVNQPVSATQIREAVSGKRAAGRLLNPAVAEYIKKMRLYR